VTLHPQAPPARKISLSKDDYYPGKSTRNAPTSRTHAPNYKYTSSIQDTKSQVDPHPDTCRQQTGPIDGHRNTATQPTLESGDDVAGSRSIQRNIHPQDLFAITSENGENTINMTRSVGYRHHDKGKHDSATELNQRLSMDTIDENPLLIHDSSSSRDATEPTHFDAQPIVIQDFSPHDTTHDDVPLPDSSDQPNEGCRTQ
jgi:hypothetical protein